MAIRPDLAQERLADVFAKLYWAMRIGMAAIWLWTAAVSWFFYPHAESLEWLRRLGLTYHTQFIFIGACIVDLAMGIASVLFASKKLWQLQFGLVTFYTFAIAVCLPEFLIHPFGPIIKNVAVLACLAFLYIVEER